MDWDDEIHIPVNFFDQFENPVVISLQQGPQECDLVTQEINPREMTQNAFGCDNRADFTVLAIGEGRTLRACVCEDHLGTAVAQYVRHKYDPR
jgi:hypothetical protein